MKLILPQKKKPVPQATPSQETLKDLDRRTLDGLLGEADSAVLTQVQEAQARIRTQSLTWTAWRGI